MPDVDVLVGLVKMYWPVVGLLFPFFVDILAAPALRR